MAGFAVSRLPLDNSIPVLQIRHSSIIRYNEPIFWKSRRNNVKTWTAKNLNKNAYSGKVTQGVKKRMTKALNIMLMNVQAKWKENPYTKQLQYHKLSFITLKIPPFAEIDERTAYDQVFSRFLDWLKRTSGVCLYVWKLEHDKNTGAIHYHVTMPDMLHLKVLRDKWNSILRINGLLDEYAKKHLSFDANSTDIHSVNHVGDLARYMVKAFCNSLEAANKANVNAEMAKDLQNEVGANSRIWGCSEILSASHYVTFTMSRRHYEVLDKMIELKQVKAMHDEGGIYSIYFFNDGSPPDVLEEKENNYVKDYFAWQFEKPEKGATDLMNAWQMRKPLY